MKLFSWFLKSKQVSKSKSVIIPLHAHLTSAQSNNMWPIAKVRTHTFITQQQYKNTLTNLKGAKIIKLREHKP